MKGTQKGKIIFRSPTRVDLAGGTLDLWPLYLFFKKSFVINFSIDLYTQVEIEERRNRSVHVNLSNFGYKEKFLSLKNLLNSREIRKKKLQKKHQKKDALFFLMPHFKYWMPKKGFLIQTFSNSPLQAGIGGSSSLCISLIQAFSKWMKKEKMSKEAQIRFASNIEASGLGFPTGTQDYFPAIQPGLHIIQYGLKQKLFFKKVKNHWREVFQKNMLLVDTGIPHQSALLNWKIYKAFLEGDQKIVSSLKKISDFSEKVAQACLKEDWEELPYWINQEFLIRCKMSKSFAYAKILDLRKEVLKRGAKAFKLCGAGGGGVALIWFDRSEDKERVMGFLKKKSIHFLKARPIGNQMILSFF